MSANGDPAAAAAAAFFDLDRTLMAGSSGFYWARAAAAAGLMTRRRLAADAWQNVLFRLRGSTDEGTERVKARVSAMLRDRPVRDFQRLGPQVLADVLPRMYPQMLRVAWDHQDAGRRVYIVTAASQETADLLAHVLGFDGALGSPLESIDGIYTGEFTGPMNYREGKPERMRELAAAEGIDLSASYAYSDSESDLPMMRVVGHPVAVNPDGPLAKVARDEGWEVMRFERIGRRLAAVAAIGLAAAVGGAGRTAARRVAAQPSPARRRLTRR